ncbi:response regulator [Micromonospora okii]|uniref:response regulator n=1 Tax=Micromonospora okii TaxID=1182970 RepID=UPI001E285EF2|nr:response regulator [Micromonospora okii]
MTTTGEAPRARPAALRVLLVEDDPADVALVRAALDAHHLDVELEHAPDGVEAMAFLRREGPHAEAARPDLILLDLNMPRMNGRAVLAAVKADAQLKAIPVVMLTTSAMDTDVLTSYSTHANAYVTKPLALDDYERVIAEILQFYGRVAELPPPPAAP